MTVLLRLCYLFPYNALNFFLGITSVKVKDYIFGCIGMLPLIAAYVCYGSGLGVFI